MPKDLELDKKGWALYIEDVDGRPILTVEKDGTVTLYKGTTSEAAHLFWEEIERQGKLRAQAITKRSNAEPPEFSQQWYFAIMAGHKAMCPSCTFDVLKLPINQNGQAMHTSPQGKLFECHAGSEAWARVPEFKEQAK